MGTVSAKEYQDGDIPRNEMSILHPLGFAYYSCSSHGECSVCETDTKMWQVSIKDKGRYLCRECDSNIKAQHAESLAYYASRIVRKNEHVI
jgi:hypothetical protein